jgi:hypothetical protein
MFAGRYADAARRRITEALEGSEFGINAFKSGPNCTQEPLSSFGRCDAPRGAVEQP